MKRLCLALFLFLFAGPALAANVGFSLLQVPNGAEAPLKVGVWYPTEAPQTEERLGLFTQAVARDAPVLGRGLPLVVVSHGNGGWLGSHYDTARALAAAGYVVAAVSHTGDTHDDQSRAAQPWLRTGQIKTVVSYMLGDWADSVRLDAGRIGLFGYSAGGLTGLATIGGAPDLSTMAPHCKAHKKHFDCQLLKRAGVKLGSTPLPPRQAWTHDDRIRAAVIAAPALGYAFGTGGLKDVTVPVQLWRAEFDTVLPETLKKPIYALVVKDALPTPPEYHLVSGAGHYEFLAPCSQAMAAQSGNICKSHPGFDRPAFHTQFNAQVLAFFDRTLR